MAAGDGKVYIVGGTDPITFGPVDAIDVYDEVTGTWSSLTLPEAQYNARAAYVGGKLIAGSGTVASLDPGDVHIYDTTSGSWSSVTLSAPRTDCTFVVVGTYLVIGGGFDAAFGNPTWHDAVDVYESTFGTWTTASLQVEVSSPAGVWDGGSSAIFAGGRDNTAFFTDEAQSLTLLSTSGSIGNLSVPRTAISAGRIGTDLVFAGGYDNTGSDSDVFDIYDTVGGTWSSGTLPFTNRSAHGVVVGDVMIIPPDYGPTGTSGTVMVMGPGGSVSTTSLPGGLKVADIWSTASDTAAYFAGGLDPNTFSYVGEVFIYEPCAVSGAASETVRLGTPPNPAALLPGQTNGPVLGATWDPRIDHGSFAPGAVLDFLAISTSTTNIPSPLGTLLCGTTPFLVLSNVSPGTSFLAPIPYECANVGVPLYTQGGSLTGSGTIELTNALDIVLGTY